MANDKVAATLHDADLPIGTPVTYWPGAREGEGTESFTRSNVWSLWGRPGVLVQGQAGVIALTHIERREATEEEPDLSPEQDLRAAVAERLTDATHFNNCPGGDACRCLIGRLNWAINAEEVTS